MAKFSSAMLAASLMAAGAAASSARAEDFYAGKQIDWILSAGAGGGYSAYAQAFAPFLTAHIPGHPKIVIQNMPGAGGIRAMQYLAKAAPQDGTTLGLVHSSVPFAPLYGIKGANFDPRKMHWIGSINATDAICVAWTASGMTTWNDLKTKPFLVGSTGAGSQMETMPEMIDKLFGAKMRVIGGYTGGADVYLAMERGEVQGSAGVFYSSFNSAHGDWLKEGKARILAQIGLEKHPDLSAVPLVLDFAKTPEDRQEMELAFGSLVMGRPFVAPEGLPADRIKLLRDSFIATLASPALKADAAKEKLEINGMSGEAIQALLASQYKTPQPVVDRVHQLMMGN
jgi:tripartite-type tricarboxylate transporter receptor subunit TctC